MSQQQHLCASGLGWTFLRAGFFMQNLADAYRRDIVEDDRIALRFDHDTQPDPTLTSLLGHRPCDLRSYVEEHAQLWSAPRNDIAATAVAAVITYTGLVCSS